MLLREGDTVTRKGQGKFGHFVVSVKSNSGGSPSLSSSNLCGISIAELETLSVNTFN